MVKITTSFVIPETAPLVAMGIVHCLLRRICVVSSKNKTYHVTHSKPINIFCNTNLYFPPYQRKIAEPLQDQSSRPALTFVNYENKVKLDRIELNHLLLSELELSVLELSVLECHRSRFLVIAT